MLQDLGCRVHTADLFDEMLEDQRLIDDPPTAVLIEARDRVAAGRAALMRIRAIPALAEIPALLSVSVDALQRVNPSDAFDDIILFPYVPVEIYVRIRRAEWRRSEFENHEQIKLGAVVVDLAGHEVEVDGRTVDLTHQEFALLRFLASNRGRVFSRQQLLERVWGLDYAGGSRTVDIHVRRLRMKLGQQNVPIETVRGAGYKLRAPA